MMMFSTALRSLATGSSETEGATSRAASVISSGNTRGSRATRQATSRIASGPAPKGAADDIGPAMNCSAATTSNPRGCYGCEILFRSCSRFRTR